MATLSTELNATHLEFYSAADFTGRHARISASAADTIKVEGSDGSELAWIDNVKDPTSAQHAATKNYVDGLVSSGISWKDAVARTGLVTDGTAGNITLSGIAEALDGAAPTAGMRVLLRFQTDPTENGIWVTADPGAWTRPVDFDTGSQADGAAVFVQIGTTRADTAWVQTANGVVDTVSQVWSQFASANGSSSGADGAIQLSDGNGGFTSDSVFTWIAATDTLRLDSDNAEIELGADQDLSIAHSGTAGLITNTTGNLTIDNTAVTGATIIQLGTDTSATAFQVKDNTGTTQFEVDGAGTATFTTQAHFPDDVENTFGNTAAAPDYTASWISANDEMVYDNTNIVGSTIFRLGTDTVATKFVVQSDAATTDHLKVDGSGVVTIGTQSHHPDDISATFGNTAAAPDFKITWVSATDKAVLENTNALGTTIAKLGTATTATSFQVVDSANDTKLAVYGDGDVKIPNDDVFLHIGANDELQFKHVSGGDNLINSNLSTADLVLRLGDASAVTSLVVQDSSLDPLFEMTSKGVTEFAPNAHTETAFATGLNWRVLGATVTDGTTAASGTNATHMRLNAFASSAIAATNATVTVTNSSTLYVAGPPTAGTNVTLTNAYGLYVGGTSSSKSYFEGEVRADKFRAHSDVRIKTDLVPLEEKLDPLDIISAIQPFSYRFKEEYSHDRTEQWGVVAQQLENAGLSHLVSQDDANDKHVDYIGLIPLLISSVQRLSEELEDVKASKCSAKL